MRYLIILSLVFAACKTDHKLEEKEETLDLHYIAWACACPNWATQDAMDKYEGDSLAANSIYIEPADSSLSLPDSLGYTGDIIRFTGHFYKEKGVPVNFGYKEQRPDKARILRYTSYEIVKRDSSRYYPQTDTLTITEKSAVVYMPDSLQIARSKQQLGVDTFQIGMDDYVFGLHEAEKFLETKKLPLLVTDGQHYLKFIQTDGTITIIKTDSLEALWGMYFFDPARKPKEIDITVTETEYTEFFK